MTVISRADDWRTLCELASKEKDPKKLLDLIRRISRALEESHRRSQSGRAAQRVDHGLRSAVARLGDHNHF